MVKHKKIRIKIPIFDFSFYLVITKNLQEFSEEFFSEIDGDISFSEAFMLTGSDEKIYLILKEKADIGTIAHESFHMAMYILKFICSQDKLELTKETEEICAYLLTWISERIEKEMKKNENGHS